MMPFVAPSKYRCSSSLFIKDAESGGYWAETRLEVAKRMQAYRLAFNMMAMDSGDSVLEVTTSSWTKSQRNKTEQR